MFSLLADCSSVRYEISLADGELVFNKSTTMSCFTLPISVVELKS